MTKEKLQQRKIGFGIGSPANSKRVGNSRYAATDIFHELITMNPNW